MLSANDLEVEPIPQNGTVARRQNFQWITPTQGMCIKFITEIDQTKFFVNVGKSDEIPAPDDISSDQLIIEMQMMARSKYRVPMSAAPPRLVDHKGSLVQCMDVAVHPRFVEQCIVESVFFKYLMRVLIEAVRVKYGIALERNSGSVLQKRKQIDTIGKQKIYKHQINKVHELYRLNAKERERKYFPQVTDLDAPDSNAEAKKLVWSSMVIDLPVLRQYSRLVLNRDKCVLQAEFYLHPRNGEAGITECSEILLYVGADRLRVQVPRLGILLDGCVEQSIDLSQVETMWMKANSILLVYSMLLQF